MRTVQQVATQLILLIFFQSLVSSQLIYYATSRKNGKQDQNQGSTNGGTLVWIIGQDFAQNAFSLLPSTNMPNKVQLVNGYTAFDCQVDTEEMTDTRLPCYTQAMPEGPYLARVSVYGNLIPLSQYTNSDQAYFYTSRDHTPTITSISPATGPPQRLLSLSGEFKSKCYSRHELNCFAETVPLISRIYIGEQLCNLMDPDSSAPYASVTETSLQCRFESNEVGIFNVSVLVSNDYGLSWTAPNLYRLSAVGQLYTFQTYATVFNVSPDSGSTQGGTILTVNGEYFTNSSRYPLTVNVDEQTCTILSANSTTIQCQVTSRTASNRTRFHGGRGLHLFYERIFLDLNYTSNSTPRMPSVTANQTWTEEASFYSSNISNGTVWLIGYIRPLVTAFYTFQLDTTVNSTLYLSTNENPENVVQIANRNSLQSMEIFLENNTNYYMLCMGSSRRGTFSLSIKLKMRVGESITGSDGMGTVAIQKIAIGNTPIKEHQRIIYTNNTSTNATAEVQKFAIPNVPFQIGFRGVYTALLDDFAFQDDVQAALNDLPTIAPLAVAVTVDRVSYKIVFPLEMGDVPLLTILSTAFNTPQNATETRQGVASGSHFAFELDGATTSFLNFSLGTVTNEMLESKFHELFAIRCPPSLYNKEVTQTIVYSEEFEDDQAYDESFSITDVAFCGRRAFVVHGGQRSLIAENNAVASHMCFAYKLPKKMSNITMFFHVESDVDFGSITQNTVPILLQLTADTRWHYKCIELETTLQGYSYEYLFITWFIIKDVYLSDESDGAMIDTVTLRTSWPIGYEHEGQIDSSDQNVYSNCTFPFVYNGQSFSRCTLNGDKLPICAVSTNQTSFCTSSTIEGVRRLYPKFQLLYNSLIINHVTVNRTIDVFFRYLGCHSPTLIKPIPSAYANVTSVSRASERLHGTYDIRFNGSTYMSIPAAITGTHMANLLQFYADFGYVNVDRTGECANYVYTIEWLSKGQRPLISITNRSNIRPEGTRIDVSSIQTGSNGDAFYSLPNDMIRTHHQTPQVEVFVGGYPSRCSGTNNSCPLQFSSNRTPTIQSIQQNETLLIINGNGFSPSLQANVVSIGEQGLCNVTNASTARIICTVMGSFSGQQIVRVYVAEKGYASSNGSVRVNVPLMIRSFHPREGAAGGGYPVMVNGNGFSSNTQVTLGGSLCTNIQVMNFSSITCIVPPSATENSIQVQLSAIDGTRVASTSSSFTYNATDAPIIRSIEPRFIGVGGGILNITGRNFGNGSVSAWVGDDRVVVINSSASYIEIDAPKLPPGPYPITINTSVGYARSVAPVEYRFYIQQISPRVGSLYGGSDIHIQGVGFDNTTTIQFRAANGRISPCTVLSVLPSRIHCRTTSFVQKVTIKADGVHPSYGAGYAWSPQRQIVQQGAIVTWMWNLSAIVSPLEHRIQQVANAYSTEPILNGFDSGVATPDGLYSYQFNTLGTYYYWSSWIDRSRGTSLRGVINVVAAEPEIWTVEAVSDTFTAQSCVFPFTYNSINYTDCISINDTQRWCSPSSIYVGQRLYCEPSVMYNTTCSSSTLNASLCNQTVPKPTQFLPTNCDIASIISISPTEGTANTLLIITGTGFYGNLCEYDVQIGPSYHCPIVNMTFNQLICRITNNSMLNGTTSYSVRVSRDRRGYLRSQDQLYFRFQASISRISPMIGSIYGGTRVKIEGTGFIPSRTRVFIDRNEYTDMATVTYARIDLTTLPQPMDVDRNWNVLVAVGIDEAECLTPPCQYSWATSVTPYFDAVTPESIDGPTNLTLTGRNLLVGDRTSTDVHVTISESPCLVARVTNTMVTCSVDGVSEGFHQILGTIDGIGIIDSSVFITSNAVLRGVSPTASSVYGGAPMTITGNGFARNAIDTEVVIGVNLCPITQATVNTVQCIVPAQGESSDQAAVMITSNGYTFSSDFSLTYDASITPFINSVNWTSSRSSIAFWITGRKFVIGRTTITVGKSLCRISSMSSVLITCNISAQQPAGYHPIVVYVNAIGKSNANKIYTHDLLVTGVLPSEGGYGGGLPVIVTGDGFNGSNTMVRICNRSCSSLTIVSNTKLICTTPSISGNEANSSYCNVTVTSGGMSNRAMFTYVMNLTASVQSIYPTQGGTGGGTKVTITGRDFSSIANRTRVTIDNADCSILSINATTILCETGSHYQTNLEAEVRVFTDGRGYAHGHVSYRYLDLWSSRWTWGGDVPPEADTIVSIEGGATVYLDVIPPKLKALVIDNATLIFYDTQDLELNVEYIVLVNGGRLQVGTESEPFQHRAIITIYGHSKSVQIPIFGAKVLAVRNGMLDMHGTPTIRTWTKLGATAMNGSSTIILQHAVNWTVGNRIVVATTGDHASQSESEVRRIINISSNGLNITLDKPLKHTHLGATLQFNTKMVEVRGEVGLLSHNVVFQGSSNDTWRDMFAECPSGFTLETLTLRTCLTNQYDLQTVTAPFGAIITASPELNDDSNIQQAVVRISNVELFNVGQELLPGRYPVYFGMNGNASMSYVKSSSIHLSHNRAIDIHASNYLTIENNVIYNILGSGIFLSDSTEIGNVFRGNLLVLIQSSPSLTTEDLTPAAFWLTNPNNTLEHNAIAGATHYGHWYRLFARSDDLSSDTTQNFYPYKQPFGRFFNNSVHSVGEYGVWIYPQYEPSVSGNFYDARRSKATFDGLISWRNKKGIEYISSKPIQIKNALVFDNTIAGIACITAAQRSETDSAQIRSTFFSIKNGSSVTDSIIIGHTNTSDGYNALSDAGLIVTWDRGFLVRNVTFINFLNPETAAILGPTIADGCMDHCGGFLTKFSLMTFINVLHRAKFRWNDDGLYEDVDGTLTGENSSRIVMALDGLNNGSRSCVPAPRLQNAVQCLPSGGSWIRVTITENSDWPQTINYGLLRISDKANHTIDVPWVESGLTFDNGYTALLQANQTYELGFVDPSFAIWDDITYTLTFYDMAPGDFLIIKHRMQSKPDAALVNESLTPLSGVNNINGQWFYNDNSTMFSYIVKHSSTTNTVMDLSLKVSTFRCSQPDCVCHNCVCRNCTPPTTDSSVPPTEETIEIPTNTTTPAPECITWEQRYWSKDNDWSDNSAFSIWNFAKPGDYQDIFIPSCYNMIIDCPLPRIRSLTVAGVVQFQQELNHTMYVDRIDVQMGGTLIAGSRDDPFRGTIDIIFTSKGSNTISPLLVPMLEASTMSVEGGLNLHGRPHNIVWTRLAQTASSNSTLLELSQAVDWQIGDEVVITTTDTNISHTERHRIAAVINETTIRIGNSLAYTHLVIHHAFPNGQQVNIAAAVGLLTRNIRVMSYNARAALSGLKMTVFNPYSNPNPGSTYVRLSNIQFIGFGQFDDTPTSDQNAGIYIDDLDASNFSPDHVYIDACSFDGGFNAAIGVMNNARSISVTNNIVYNTYRSGIVIRGKNNFIRNNLVTTIYWTGTAQAPSIALFNINYDAAITSRDAISVTMENNFVAGVERLAYRIQGDPCTGSASFPEIINSYAGNEAHSSMVGVSLWPTDRGFFYDRQCVLIKGFTVYKAWYYGFYINTFRNITIDACASIDNHVGIFTFVVGPPAQLHMIFRSRVNIQNSLVIGAITANDCADKVDLNSTNVIAAWNAMPDVAADSAVGSPGSRSGIVFPVFSGRNNMPTARWTRLNAYPCLDGSTVITNTTLAFFNYTCNRRDTAIQVPQSNDAGQFPITASSLFQYNISKSNLIFNGKPNADAVNADDCGDMDCDGLKKNLVILTDGGFYNAPTSLISQANAFWDDDGRHKIGDHRIPPAARLQMSYSSNNSTSRYPYRGISGSNLCINESAWGMYQCHYMSNYRMLIIESMDANSETAQISPVALLSDSGYIDLLNGPPDHGVCTSRECRRRLSTFMAIVQSKESYAIYFTSTPPKHLRFRLIKADASIRCILAVYYDSLQQIDVYASGRYVSPTNRDPSSNVLLLRDEDNKVNLSSPVGTNFFNRTSRLVYVMIDGDNTIDIKVSPLFILHFGLPPVNESTFYLGNVASNLAAFFNVDPTKFRRVKIVRAAESNSGLRSSRQSSSVLAIEMRDDPRATLSSNNGIRSEVMSNVATVMINSYQAGELLAAWKDRNFTRDVIPLSLSVQEPFSNSSVDLGIINRTVLQTSPGECRQQSPCTIQPVLIAYDSEGNIIQKLGSVDRPWQVKAIVINQPTLVLQGGVTNYSDGQTQFSLFALPNIGTFGVQFTFIQPNGVSSSFSETANLTVYATSVAVTNANLGGQQINPIAAVNISQAFHVSVMPIDSITRRQLGKIQWGNWTWKGKVTLHMLPKFNAEGVLIVRNTSRTRVNLATSSVTINDLSINAFGMYVLHIKLVSTNNEHVITLTSNSILVGNVSDDESFVRELNEMTSNITFTGDYDALLTANQLEVKRAMIHNYLISIGMPLISDIILIKGGVIAMFQVDSLAENISRAVTTLLANPDAVPGLSVLAVNINGRSYALTSATSRDTTAGNTTGIIVGVVVGVIIVSLLVFAIILVYIRQRRKKGRGVERRSSNAFLSELKSAVHRRALQHLPISMRPNSLRASKYQTQAENVCAVKDEATNDIRLEPLRNPEDE